VFLVGSVLLIFLVFCVVFLVGSVLLIFLVFCVVFFALFVFVFCLVFPMLSVSLNCPFLIVSSFFFLYRLFINIAADKTTYVFYIMFVV
jgi:hypothetical protein